MRNEAFPGMVNFLNKMFFSYEFFCNFLSLEKVENIESTHCDERKVKKAQIYSRIYNSRIQANILCDGRVRERESAHVLSEWRELL